MKILIAAGATKEYIDPIRFISNDSSGKMGIALLKEAISRKYKVKFIYGSGKALNERTIKNFSKVKGIEKIIHAVDYEDFRDNILREVYDCKIFLCPAAISDFTVEKKDFKIKSNDEILLKLKPAEKIVKLVKEKFPDVFVVAFKAEYNVSNDELKKAGIEKLKNENLDMVVANDVARSEFGSNKAGVVLIHKNKILNIKDSKRKIAKKIFDFIENVRRG